jgi:hypothetical protein
MSASKEITALVRASNSGQAVPAMKLIDESPAMASIMSKLNNQDRNVKYDQDGNRTIVAPNRSGLSDISHDTAQKSTDNENTLQLFPELEQGIRILINGVMAPKDLNSTDINFSLPNDLKVSPLASKLIPIIEETLSKDFNLKDELPDTLYRVLAVDGAEPHLIIPESAVDDMINDRKTVSTESLVEHFGDGKSNLKTSGLLGNSNFSSQGQKGTVGAGNFGFESFVQGTHIKQQHITDNRVMFRSPNMINSKDLTVSAATGHQDVDSLVRVTDNIDLVKFPVLMAIQRQNEVNRHLGKQFRGSIYAGNQDLVDAFKVATESLRTTSHGDINNPNKVYGSTQMNDIQLTQLLYKSNPNIRNVTRKVKTSNETVRENIGRPLEKRLPAECLIPVCRANDSADHIAYFVLMDGMGNPLSKDSAESAFDDFRRNQRGFQSNNNLPSYLMQKTAEAFSTSCDQVTYQQMQKIATDIIETDLLARMRNGVFGDDVALVAPDVVYDIMLARMFREQQTQVLFVPAELLVYYHYKLRRNGTGKSLLEDSMTLNTLRAVLMFANVNRAVINSMGRTEVELQIDELDPNKTKTLEIAKHEALKFRQSQALPATISPTDINHWLKTAGVNFKIPQVPGLPNTAINITETASAYSKPDTELMDALDKKAFNGIGIPPELVGSMDQVEYATNILANNIRLNKYVMQLQDAFTPEVNKFCRTFCMNHGDVVRKVEETIRANLSLLTQIKKPDEFIMTYATQEDFLVRLLAREFLSNFEFSFSRPDTVTLKNQLEALTQYVEGVTTGVKHYLSEDIISAATSGQATAEQIGLIQNSCISHFVREYMKKNAVLPELFDITRIDDDGKSTVILGDSIAAHANQSTSFINTFLSKVIPVAKASERDVEKLTQGDELEAGPTGDSGGGGGSISSSGDTGGDEDLGGDTDTDTETGGDDLLSDLPGMPSMDSF